MASQEYARRVWIEAPAAEVFAWHERDGAFERLAPPWEDVEVVDRAGGIRDGAQVVVRLRMGPLRPRWTLMHQDYVEGQQFRDVQVGGPFAEWSHLHRVVPEGPGRCYLEDRIDYTLPFGLLGTVLGRPLLRRKLERLFTHRHRVLVQDLATHRRYRDRGGKPMRVLVSGSSGLVGTALVPLLTTGSHEVTRLVRSEPGPGEVRWDPSAGEIDPTDLEGFDAVVHLGGENISTGRWTDEKKQRIRESRVDSTLTLSEALARLGRPPGVLVCASAVGYYGDRGDVELQEDSGAGSGFLSEVCREWEGATLPASESGIRVVRL
ncbi:MAG: SRPBCC family protein, partial [Candidatus Latescibacteria bacterium]|nr:SRPBCC family protein [Candidatus Latescibacterota bacterium]